MGFIFAFFLMSFDWGELFVENEPFTGLREGQVYFSLFILLPGLGIEEPQALCMLDKIVYH